MIKYVIRNNALKKNDPLIIITIRSNLILIKHLLRVGLVTIKVFFASSIISRTWLNGRGRCWNKLYRSPVNIFVPRNEKYTRAHFSYFTSLGRLRFFHFLFQGILKPVLFAILVVDCFIDLPRIILGSVFT